MGFLDKLKDIGFGNRGPYGRQVSGATNLSNYMSDRFALEGQRGFSQALALSVAEGKPIAATDTLSLADKWGVPMSEALSLAKKVNLETESEQIKSQVVAIQKIVNKMSPEEKKRMSAGGAEFQKFLDSKLPNLNINSVTAWAKRHHELSGQIDRDPSKEMGRVSIGGSWLPEKAAVTKTTQVRATWTQLPNETIKGVEYKVQRSSDGKIERQRVGPALDKDSDFEKAYSQHIAIPGNEKVTRAEFRTGPYATKTGELTDNAAFELLQNHALTLTDGEDKYPIFIEQYNKYRKEDLGRREAVEKVIKKVEDPALTALAKRHPAAKHKGRTILDNETNNLYKSDGVTWNKTN